MGNIIVQIKLDEYKRLENAANRSDELVQKLAERKAKELKSFQVRLHMYDTNYERECPIDINSYDELTPQMEDAALKLKYWAQEQLAEEFKSWHYMQKARGQLAKYSKSAEKWQRKAKWSWVISGVLIVCVAYMYYFTKP